MNQKDQYDNNIPQDLILLEIEPGELTNKEIKQIDDLDWYCFEGNKTQDIFVSKLKLEEIKDSILDDFVELGDYLFEGKLLKIDRVLHRNTVRGQFYWA